MRFTGVFVFISVTAALAQSYEPSSGPSILSRGGRVGSRGTEPAALNFSAGVSGVYDNSLGTITLTPGDVNKQDAAFGTEANATLTGVHQWRRSSLGVSYAGSYVKYVNSALYNGTTQSLALQFSTQHSKRLSTNYSLAAGTSNRPYGGIGAIFGDGSVGASAALDSNFLAVPVQELFNNRTDFVQGGAGFVYQMNNRLSFKVAGSGYGVRRKAKGLGGLNGYLGNADLAYRLNKRASISLMYSFTHMEFPGAFGASDIHGMGAAYARSIGRDWQLNVSGMLNQVESLGLARVALDPLVASLLGQSSGVEAFYRKNQLPGYAVSLSRRMRRSTISFSTSKSISPGNGLFLTTQQTGATGNYSYTGVRYWSLGATIGYAEMNSLTRSAGKFKGVNASLSASRAIYRTLHFTSNWNFRDQLIETSTFKRSGSSIRVGLAWSLRQVPLSIW